MREVVGRERDDWSGRILDSRVQVINRPLPSHPSISYKTRTIFGLLLPKALMNLAEPQYRSSLQYCKLFGDG